MSGFEHQLGFTIAATKIQAVELTFRKKEYIFEHVDEVFFEEPINFERDKDGKILTVLGSALSELFLRNEFKAKTVSFAFPMEVFVAVCLPYDKTLLEQDLLKQFRWDFAHLFPQYKPEEISLRYAETPENPFYRNNTAIVFGLKKRFTAIAAKLCSENSLSLKYVDACHFASDRAIALNYDTFKEGTVLSIYISGKVISCILLIGGEPVFMKTLKVRSPIEIPQGVLNFFKTPELQHFRKDEIITTFLAGEEISPTLVQSVERQTGLKIQPINPFRKLRAAPRLADNKHYKERFPLFSSAAGITFRLV